MKKIITLLLAVIMVAAIFASCTTEPAETTPAPNDNPPTEAPGSGGNGTPGETTPPPPPANDELNIDLEAIDYQGEEVFFYTWNAGSSMEFTVDEEAAEGDPINEALYKRNLFVEEELGVTLNIHSDGGGAGQESAWIDALKLRVEDPETPVDILGCYSRAAPYALINGFAVDLETYSDDLDLEKDWWPDLVKDEHMIRGRLFYVSGDASPGLLLQMQALFMNKTIFSNLGNDYEAFMKDITEDPAKSTWTLDKMIEICVPAYADNDGVAGKSVGDTFGYVAEQFLGGDSFWQTTGYKLFKYSEKEGEVYVISDELAGEAGATYVNKMKEWNNTDSAWIGVEAEQTWTSAKCNEHFGAAKTLFTTIRFINWDAAAMEVDYAVVPHPKYEAKQERFYTCVGNPYTLYCISPTSRDLDRAAQVIQVMGYKGYNETTPAIFETVFKGQYSKDDYSIAACNVIREAITFDVGRTFDRITSTMLPNFVSGPIARNEAWSFTAVVRKSFNAKMKNVNKQILEVLENIQ